MKKLNRMTSLLLALVLALSIAVLPASAVDASELEDDPLLAAALAADDCEIRYTADGSARIISATLPADQIPVATRSSNPMYTSGTASWNAYSKFSFQCRNGWGKHARFAVYNTDSTWKMNCAVDTTINGTPVSMSDNINPNDRKVYLIDSTNNNDLTCRVDFTLKPLQGALNVTWSFEGSQG